MSEKELKAQLALNQAITRSVAEGIYATDHAGRFTFVNPVAQEMLGWPETDLLGRKAHETIHFRRPDGTVFPVEDCPLLAVLASGGELRNHEDVFVRKDGSALPVLCSSAPILTNEAATGAVVAFADITEQKRAQAELQAAYQRERRIAETLQRSLLMRPAVNAFPHLAVETLYEPASDEAKLGGDFYDAFGLPDGTVALVVGDICGQGLAAAAWSAEVKYALRAFLYADPAPERAVEMLNDYLCSAWAAGSRKSTVFVALSAVVVETETGRARLVSAGIEPPLLLRATGGTESGAPGGLPLGLFPEERYEAQTILLEPGDTLIQVTDGITEARAPRSGPDRRRPLLQYEGFARLARAARNEGSLRTLGLAILEGARSFAHGTLGDDVCVLLARWR